MGINSSKHVEEKRKTTRELKDRATAAVIAAFVADAATLPLHHVEGQKAVEDLLLKRSDGFSGPEFYPINETPFNDPPRHSLYANETFPLMESITRLGYLDIEDAQNEYLIFYNTENFKKYSESMNHFIERRRKGMSFENSAHMTDCQFTAAMKVIVLVARYAGSPLLMNKVTEVVNMAQRNPEILVASRIFARLLEKVILGGSIADTLEWALNSDETILPTEEKEYLYAILPDYLNYVQKKKTTERLQPHSSMENLSPKTSTSYSSDSDTGGGGPKSSPFPHFNPMNGLPSFSTPKQMPFAVAAQIYGTDGTVPECLQTSLYALNLNSLRSYESAVRANISIPGDNVCRSWIIGSMLAAEQGMSAIPVSWKNRTPSFRHIESLTKVLVGSNQYFDSLTENHCVLPSLSLLGTKTPPREAR